MPRPRTKAGYAARAVAKTAVKKRPGPKSQGAQIAKLASAVSDLADASAVPLCLQWQRFQNKLSSVALDLTAGTGNGGQLIKYVCPIPIAPSVTAGTFLDNSGIAAAQGEFKKTKVWITGPDATNKPRVKHMGSELTYFMQRGNLSERYVTVALISANSAVADQLIKARDMQTTLGATALLQEQYDYVYNQSTQAADQQDEPMTGFEFNPQYWNVHYKRVHKFGCARADIASSATLGTLASTACPTSATGTIKIPAKGAVYSVAALDPTQTPTAQTYAQQRAEKCMFLVVLSQRGSASPAGVGNSNPDNQEGELVMSFACKDRYLCTDGSITPHSGYFRAGGGARGAKRQRVARTVTMSQ